MGQEELKVFRNGHDAMTEQDAVYIGCEADVIAHLLDTDGDKIGLTRLLDSGAVVSVMAIMTWERIGFTREELIPTNIRLAAANRGAIYIAGRTPKTVFYFWDRKLQTRRAVSANFRMRNLNSLSDSKQGCFMSRM